MTMVSVTYASAPSEEVLIPTLEFNNEAAGVIRLIFYMVFTITEPMAYP